MSAERRHLLADEKESAEGTTTVSGTPISSGSSVDELIDNIGFGWYQLRLAILIGIALLADGMETSLISLIQGCVIITFDVSTVYESIFSSIVFLGQISGMILIAPLADLYGRKIVILLGYFLMMVFGLVSYVSPDIWFLIGIIIINHTFILITYSYSLLILLHFSVSFLCRGRSWSKSSYFI